MAVIRKVQSKLSLSNSSKELPNRVEKEYTKDDNRMSEGLGKEEISRPKKYCHFCKNKVEPHYWDVTTLRRYLTDRGRIVSRSRCGACSKHQRKISREIKRARHLSLLPYLVQI